jgi:hypothetical protein
MKSCVILGPSKIQKIKRFGHVKDTGKYAAEAAQFFAKHFDSILIIPDNGVPLKIAREYKKINKNKKVIGYVPGKTKKGKSIDRYYKYCDEVKDIGGGWFNLNTELTRQSDYVFCLGFSAGVFIELCSIKYNQVYVHLNTKIFIDERCISQKLPREVTVDLKNLLYFSGYGSLEKLKDFRH